MADHNCMPGLTYFIWRALLLALPVKHANTWAQNQVARPSKKHALRDFTCLHFFPCSTFLPFSCTLRALIFYVSCVPSVFCVPTCHHFLRIFIFLRALRVLIFFTYLTWLHFFTCLTCLHFFYGPSLFLSALKVSSFWRALCAITVFYKMCNNPQSIARTK